MNEDALEETVRSLREACEEGCSDFPFWRLQQCVELFVAIKKRVAERMESNELLREDYDQRKLWVLVQCAVEQKIMAEDLKESRKSIEKAGLQEEIGPAATSGRYGHFLSILRDEYYDKQAQLLWNELTHDTYNRGHEHFIDGEMTGDRIAAAIVRVIRVWEDDELPDKVYRALSEFYDNDLPVLMKSAFIQADGNLAASFKPSTTISNENREKNEEKFEYDDEDFYIVVVLDTLQAKLTQLGEKANAEYVAKVKSFVEKFLDGDEVDCDSYEFGVSLERNDELQYIDFYISDSEMEICCGGSVDSGCGHDSHSNIAWSIVKGHHCEYDYSDIDSDVFELLSCGAEFGVTDYAE